MNFGVSVCVCVLVRVCAMGLVATISLAASPYFHRIIRPPARRLLCTNHSYAGLHQQKYRTVRCVIAKLSHAFRTLEAHIVGIE